MDPDTALGEMRELAKDILAKADQDDRDDKPREEDSYGQLAVYLAERVNDLDEWLCKGGYFPSDWRHGT